MERNDSSADEDEDGVARVAAHEDEQHEPGHVRPRTLVLLALQAIGVIYGDIGTSPLYVMSSIFKSAPSNPDQFIGACSLIIWAIILFVCLLAAVFLLLADHHGEGGIFALASLMLSGKHSVRKWRKQIVIVACIFGASLLVGDGALTPAISVISAVEGLVVRLPSLHPAVVPITIIILIGLFSVQPFGTQKVGLSFSPIMIVWFASIFSIGVWRITEHPQVLRAFNPWEGIRFASTHGSAGYLSLGAVFLAVTGLEALYADMGHFGPWPIRLSWFLVVFPSVTANYLGQAALLVQYPHFIDNPFYRAVPTWAYWPMLILATLAATVASQAIITGAFSLASQAIALGLAPPMSVRHTSHHVAGQIFVPFMNVILMLMSIGLVVGFGSSAKMTSAYGVAVCLMTLLITVLYSFVIVYHWRLHWSLAVCFGIVFVGLSALFLGAILRKVPEGGWITLLIALIFFLLMLCWWICQKQLHAALKRQVSTTTASDLKDRIHAAVPHLRRDKVALGRQSLDLAALKDEATPRSKAAGQLLQVDLTEDKTLSVARVPGIGVFLTPYEGRTSPAFERMISHIHGLPQLVIFLHIVQERRAFVPAAESMQISTLGEGIHFASVHKGFADQKVSIINLMHDLQRLSGAKDWPSLNGGVSVFTTAESVIPSGPWYKRWSLYLFANMKQLFPGESTVIEVDPAYLVSVGIPCEL